MGQKNITKHRVPQARRGTEPKIIDSYHPKGGIHEPAQCEVCQSVYLHKRWYLKDDPVAQEALKETPDQTICPACRKTQDQFPGGIITLHGAFLKDHKDEILHLIRNEEARAKKGNPLEGIISIKEIENRVEVRTTSEKFAQRVGKELHRAFKGEVNYQWTQNDKFVRVDWHRDPEEKGV